MKMSVRKKLYVSFGFILAIMVAMVCTIWMETTQSHKVADEIRLDDVPETVGYLTLIDEAGDVYRDASGAVTGIPGALQDYQSNQQEFTQAISMVKDLESPGTSDYQRILEIEKLMRGFTSGFETKIVPLIENKAALEEEITQLRVLYETYLTPLEDLLDQATASETAKTEAALLELNDSLDLIEKTLIILFLVAATLTIAVAYLLSKSITTRLSNLEGVAQRVANGDLTSEPISDDSGDELANLAQSINKMQHSLVTLIGSISSVAHEVKGVTSELTIDSQNIVQGASSQSDKANLITTAAEELSATIAEVSQQGTATYDEAQRSEQSALSGRNTTLGMAESIKQVSSQMSELTTQMDELGNHGEQIGSVVKVIEDIAEQTNLLALNAAIEAARAGDLGRGFAVVADEVRALAERTTKATQEVGELIQQIQTGTKDAVAFTRENSKLAEEGVDRSHGAVGALEEIVEGAANVQSMVDTIATATEEQTAVTKEIAKDITAINDISAQSLELANRSSERVSGLSNKVTELEQLVGKFKLN